MKPIKILHTSDWHLGKKLFKHSRLPEQELFLDHLLTMISEESIDLLLIAGDIFDTPQPPHEAITLFFKYLKKFSDTGVKIFLIAGNHDSARFIDSPSPLLEELNIHVSGELITNDHQLNVTKNKIAVEIHGQKISIGLLPFFRNFEIEAMANKKGIELQAKEDVLSLIENIFNELHDDKAQHNILMAHHLTGPYSIAGSEQGISLLNLDSIPTELIAKYFNYAAFGHIHKRQMFQAQQTDVVYCGSPIPMRFSESNQKSVEIITIDDGEISHTPHELPLFRKLHRLSFKDQSWQDEFSKIDLDIQGDQKLPPFVEVTVELSSPNPQIFENMRREIEDKGAILASFIPLLPTSQKEIKDQKDIIDRIQHLDQLFDLFYKERFPQSKPTEDVTHLFQEILQEVNLENEESQ